MHLQGGVSVAYCEDYPACGHTPLDPCDPQPYDAPGYYDTSIPGNEHALCEHEHGFCDVDDYDDEEEEEEKEEDDDSWKQQAIQDDLDFLETQGWTRIQ